MLSNSYAVRIVTTFAVVMHLARGAALPEPGVGMGDQLIMSQLAERSADGFATIVTTVTKLASVQQVGEGKSFLGYEERLHMPFSSTKDSAPSNSKNTAQNLATELVALEDATSVIVTQAVTELEPRTTTVTLSQSFVHTSYTTRTITSRKEEYDNSLASATESVHVPNLDARFVLAAAKSSGSSMLAGINHERSKAVASSSPFQFERYTSIAMVTAIPTILGPTFTSTLTRKISHNAADGTFPNGVSIEQAINTVAGAVYTQILDGLDSSALASLEASIPTMIAQLPGFDLSLATIVLSPIEAAVTQAAAMQNLPISSYIREHLSQALPDLTAVFKLQVSGTDVTAPNAINAIKADTSVAPTSPGMTSVASANGAAELAIKPVALAALLINFI